MIEHRYVESSPDGVRVHVAEEGPSAAGAGKARPVVLLHGFPEGWFSWRAQMKALADAGYRAVAPDLRGYGDSDKPAGVAMYKASRIADDVASVIRSLDVGPVPVVGHDWGAMIAYRVAMDHPELVSRLVIMNGPHPLHFTRVLRQSAAQRKRSWYIFFFQLPLLPERMLLRSGTMKRIFHGAVSEEALREYEEAFARPGVATSAVNFYRAARTRDREAKQKIIDKDVLVIWGVRDVALGFECLEGLERWVPRVRIERLEHAGHFVQQEAAEDVSAILLRELGEGARLHPPEVRASRAEGSVKGS
jgi:pimeloyl-ACP methyl ester carboxylesterase